MPLLPGSPAAGELDDDSGTLSSLATILDQWISSMRGKLAHILMLQSVPPKLSRDSVQQLLQADSTSPLASKAAEKFARALGSSFPLSPDEILRWALGTAAPSRGRRLHRLLLTTIPKL